MNLLFLFYFFFHPQAISFSYAVMIYFYDFVKGMVSHSLHSLQSDIIRQDTGFTLITALIHFGWGLESLFFIEN